MPVYDDEVFGPVMPIIAVANDEEAVRIANTSQYGLGATIFTADTEEAKRIASQIESGAVFINHQVKSDPRLPFGGIKKSGYGRELSHYGIKEFVNIKTVWVK
jgi:succinate-semialdehyde dehydrogenase/glutarate-semialdehyde dehydrogenase